MITKTASRTPIILASLIIGLTGAVFGITRYAHAAETVGFQISPPVQTLAMDRGTSTRKTIKVTNLTNSQMTLQLGKANFVAKGEEGEVELVDNAAPLYSLSPYFTLSQPTVTIAPRSTAEVQFVLSVPEDAEPGGRYGSITFNTIATTLPSGQSGAVVRQQLAALVFLRINGAANEQLAISSFGPDKSFYEYGPVGFTARVKNLGNVHEKPTGEIVVKNMLGFKTATVKLDDKLVIPQATRKINATLNKKLLFGNYTATLTLHNGKIQTLTAKTSFTVVPYKLIIIIVLILIVFLTFFFKTRKRFKRAFRILAGKE
jgi:hypothetical protein